MSAKDQVIKLVDYFKKEPQLKDKTDAMGDGLLLGANLADEANERSKEAVDTTVAVQDKYKEQLLAQDLNPGKDPELVDLRNGSDTAGERVAKFELQTNIRLTEITTSITYEMFGAVGDGATDDGEAIYNAHVYANEHGSVVVMNSAKNYYIKDKTEIPVMTPVNGNSATVTIDERFGNLSENAFVILSEKEPITIDPSAIELKRITKRIVALAGHGNCFVDVENSEKKNFIRKGTNEDEGSNQTDQFIIDNNGRILSDIIWDFDKLTSITLYPIDDTKLIFQNVNFVSIENTTPTDAVYARRGLVNRRSNMSVVNCSHKTIENADGSGRASLGFFRFEYCAQIDVDVDVMPRRKKSSGGADLGNYEIRFDRVVDYRMRNIKGNSMDTNRWGVHTSNYTKDCYVYNCDLNRIDAHKGIWNLTIKDTKLGLHGLKIVGGGKLYIDNLETYASSLVELRGDFGSTWNGDIEIKNIKHVTNKLDYLTQLIKIDNDGSHRFGYECMLAKNISITNYTLDDDEMLNNERDLHVFKLNRGTGVIAYDYFMPEKITLKNIKTKSGKGFKIIDGNLDRVKSKKAAAVTEISRDSDYQRRLAIQTNMDLVIDDVELYKIGNYTADANNLIEGLLYGDSYSDNYLSNAYNIVPKIIVKNAKNVFANIKSFPCELILEDSEVISMNASKGGARNNIYAYRTKFATDVSANEKALRYNGLGAVFEDCFIDMPKRGGVKITDISILLNMYEFLTLITPINGDRVIKFYGVFRNCQFSPDINVANIYSGFANYNFSLGNNDNKPYPLRKGASTARPALSHGIYPGFPFYDTTLTKMIFFDGGTWRDANGTYTA